MHYLNPYHDRRLAIIPFVISHSKPHIQTNPVFCNSSHVFRLTPADTQPQVQQAFHASLPLFHNIHLSFIFWIISQIRSPPNRIILPRISSQHPYLLHVPAIFRTNPSKLPMYIPTSLPCSASPDHVSSFLLIHFFRIQHLSGLIPWNPLLRVRIVRDPSSSKFFPAEFILIP